MINPFVLNEETIPLTIGNISGMLSSYLTCNWVDYVVFPYGFHGARQQIWTAVQRNLAEVPHRFIPITLTCSLQENTDRMKRDRRDAARIQRALASRNLYDSLPYPTIDSTKLSVNETADKVIAIVHENT